MAHETTLRPKPLLEVGGRPILWHILKIFQAHGVSDFVICVGYAGHLIADYFRSVRDEDWQVQVLDTGESTATAGRLRQARSVVGDSTFCMAYGDGVADLDVTGLIASHRSQGKLVTITAVQPKLPFGVVTFSENGRAGVGFREKPRMTDLWVNSGFFVIEPRALDYIDRDDEPWEVGPMTRLADSGQLAAFKHEGFWQCMDTPGDRQLLMNLWERGTAPWKVWPAAR
jgi:glucose-1-phosphate cytidylyltransferase